MFSHCFQPPKEQLMTNQQENLAKSDEIMSQLTLEHDETSNSSQQDPKQCKTRDVHDPKQDPDASQQPTKTPNTSQQDPKQCKTRDVHDPKQDPDASQQPTKTPDASQLAMNPAETRDVSQQDPKQGKTPVVHAYQQDSKQDPDGSQQAMKPATITDSSQEDQGNSHHNQNLQHSGSSESPGSLGSPGRAKSSGSSEMNRGVMYQPTMEHDGTSDASQQDPKQIKTPDVLVTKQRLPTKPDKTPADSQLSTTTSLYKAKSDESQPADQFHSAEDGDKNNSTSKHGKLLARYVSIGTMNHLFSHVEVSDIIL